MAVQLDFSGAEEQRLRITKRQQKHIRDLYKQASAEVGKLAEKAPRVPSDALRKQYLKTLQGQIDKQLKDIENQLNGTIRSGMTDTVKATVADAKTFLKENGLPIKGAYSHVPADIVQAVASGQLYTGNWTLSKALWLNTAETQRDVQSVIAQGIIQNKSAYDIAKDLEKYVDPTARKDWEWSKVYPGTRRVIDYNAQRLARTMVSHAYQQAFVRTTQKNPFVTKYKWEASNSGRVCEICAERDGQLYDKDDLPLDHPNGMCTFTAVMDNLETIGERLGNWAHGAEDPAIDDWAKDMYGEEWMKASESTVPSVDTWLDLHKAQTEDDVLGLEEQSDYGLNRAEKGAIRDYTTTSFEDWNAYLRYRAKGMTQEKAMEEAGIGKKDLSQIQLAIDAIKKTKWEEDLVLRRMSDIGDLAGLLPGDYTKNMAALQKLTVEELNSKFQGGVYQYASFTSTSSNWDAGFGGKVETIFYAPVGTQAASIMNLSTYGEEEAEVLIAPGMTARCVKIEKSDGHKGSDIRIFMEIIPG